MGWGKGDAIARRRHTPEQIICRPYNELLDREIFYTLWEAQVLIETWRTTYNQISHHSSLGNRPPEPGIRKYRQQLYERTHAWPH